MLTPFPRGVILVAITLLAGSAVGAQTVPTDSLLDEVLVTATRGSNPLGGRAIPSDVLTAEGIRERGTARLGDLLSEIGGYAPVSAFGTGVQVQGLGPDYTLVLIDGEPVVGRLNGTLDLDRLGVQSVDRVEVVRGPFSSLYGSEALAGVINVISRTPLEPLRGEGILRVESNGTSDATTGISLRRGGSWADLSLRHYRSGAYDLDATTPEPTFPAYSGYDGALRVTVPLPLGVGLAIRGRIGREDQREGTDVSLPAGSAPLTGQGLRNDWSLSSNLDRALWRGGTATARLYASRFRTETALSSSPGDTLVSQFDQAYHKAEVQVQSLVGRSHLATVGGGVVLESIDADRIGGGIRDARAVFAFAQEQWLASDQVELTASARLDAPSDYAARLSPATTILVRPLDGLSLRASLGSGFKAPTFQQRYLDFTNAAAGYTVIGASDVETVLAAYEADSLVVRYENVDALGGGLLPETSIAVNVGLEASPTSSLLVRTNAYYNRVSDLIEIVPVATLTNGRQVYTYTNLERVRTRGIELGVGWSPARGLSVEGRYQFLDAVNLGAVDAIAAGRVFTREDGRDRPLRPDEYGGLFGRSRHSGSIEVRWQPPVRGLTLSARGVVLSRYGDFDRNGNLVLDDAAEYVPGYELLHGTLTYAATEWLSIQMGVENALDYTDPGRIPALPGRRWFAGVRLVRAAH